MANNIKYAQNLIGDWSRDIYEPKKQVLQDIYQTNWNKLSNDYNVLKDTLARNYETARQTYNNKLNNIQNESFNRMNAATIDLANRGLSSSGAGNLVQNADTQMKGEDVNKALGSLLDTGNQINSGLIQGTNALGSGQTELASGLSGDLAGLTDADAANMQQYANLVGNIAESAATRAANGVSRASNDDVDELERRSRIAEVLENTEFDDETKARLLTIYLEVPADEAKNAVKAYSDNMTLDKTLPLIEKSKNNLSRLSNIANTTDKISRVVTPIAPIVGEMAMVPGDLKYLSQNALNKNNEKIKGMTYQDVYNILYGGK